MTNQRLQRILSKLAQQHAPHLINPGWEQKPNALKQLARALADYNFLIVMGSVPAHLSADKDRHIQEWVNTYARFHNLFAQTLFPSYAALEAHFADDQTPTVVVIEAHISPIVEAMAGYLVPFVASRQPYTKISDRELETLMDAVLSRLAANDLSRPIYNMLLQDGINQVRRLLQLPVQHVALTDFDRRLFHDVPKPPTMPRPVQKTERPASSPPVVESAPPPQELKLEEIEEPEVMPLTPTERMFIRPLNLNVERTPPVPPLPKTKGK